MNDLINQLLGPSLFLLIVITGFLLLLGKTKAIGKLFKGATKLVIIGFLVVAVAIPVMQEQLENANSSQDIAVLIVGGLFALVIILTLLFGFGFAGRLGERLISSFIYDVLKGTMRLLFRGFNRLF